MPGILLKQPIVVISLTRTKTRLLALSRVLDLTRVLALARVLTITRILDKTKLRYYINYLTTITINHNNLSSWH